MTKLHRLATALLALSLLAAACGEASDDPGLPPDAADASLDTKADGTIMIEGSAEATAVLALVNRPLADLAEADAFKTLLETRVHPIPVENIIAHRIGTDGLVGGPGADDGSFEKLSDLDAIEYVGPVSIERLLEIAKAEGLYTAPAPLAECPVVGRYNSISSGSYHDGRTIFEPRHLLEIQQSGCTSLTGKYYLKMSEPLQAGQRNLEPLSNLVEISTLVIDYSGNGLESLSGLRNVKRIGNLKISEEGLDDLEGLEGLEEITGTLRVEHKDSLKGLENLQRIGGEVSLTSIADLSALSSLTSLQSFSGLYLGSLEGLHNVERIEDDLWLHRGASLNGLRSLTHVGGGLEIDRIGHLNDLSGLDRLQRVEGALTLNDLAVTSLDGLGSLEAVGGLSIYNTKVVDMSALSNLQVIDGSLTLRLPDTQTSLAGLGGIENIEGALVLHDAKGIADFSAFTSLRGISGNLVVDESMDQQVIDDFILSLEYFTGSVSRR